MSKNHDKIESESAPFYNASTEQTKQEEQVIDQALKILIARLVQREIKVSQPKDAVDFLKLKLTELEHEVFAVMFLDTRHRLIDYVEMFRGTVNGANVHPREVVKEALQRNAASVVFAHNHPSGDPEPSEADRRLTTRLRDALGLVDIRVLDHVIIGAEGYIAFSECGIL